MTRTRSVARIGGDEPWDGLAIHLVGHLPELGSTQTRQSGPPAGQMPVPGAILWRQVPKLPPVHSSRHEGGLVVVVVVVVVSAVVDLVVMTEDAVVANPSQGRQSSPEVQDPAAAILKHQALVLLRAILHRMTSGSAPS